VLPKRYVQDLTPRADAGNDLITREVQRGRTWGSRTSMTKGE
jgi:hypothetical protein